MQNGRNSAVGENQGRRRRAVFLVQQGNVVSQIEITLIDAEPPWMLSYSLVIDNNMQPIFIYFGDSVAERILSWNRVPIALEGNLRVFVDLDIATYAGTWQYWRQW
jgi:hypothetical protein